MLCQGMLCQGMLCAFHTPCAVTHVSQSCSGNCYPTETAANNFIVSARKPLHLTLSLSTPPLQQYQSRITCFQGPAEALRCIKSRRGAFPSGIPNTECSSNCGTMLQAIRNMPGSELGDTLYAEYQSGAANQVPAAAAAAAAAAPP